jgi:hypothetical protein
MGKFLYDLSESLTPVCQTFIHVPEKTSYPYITLEPEHTLTGIPWGPKMVVLSIKIWSRHIGTMEILKLARSVEEQIQTFPKASLKIRESHLQVLKDGQTRVHTFKVKARVRGDYE